MFNEEFYPTPKNIISKMVAPFKAELHTMTILEPSAGKGDILDYIKELNGEYRQNNKMYCCEIDKNLQYILGEKGYRVIAEDFLTYKGDHYFDLIIMNPPFSNGVDHLLKAWEIMDDGHVVCLLNAESVRNPHTNKRELLNNLIADYGHVEYLGTAFRDAERTTGVEVALIRLQKKSQSSRLKFEFSGVNRERDPFNLDENLFKDEIAIRDVVGNMMVQYEKLKEFYIDFLRVRDGLNYYSQGLLTQRTQITGIIKECEKNIGRHHSDEQNPDARKRNRSLYNEFCDKTKLEIWTVVIEKMGMERYMTNEVRKNFGKFIETQGAMDFTKENVQNVIKTLLLNGKSILDKAVEDVFDIFTKYHKENRCHIEGWKTNDRWKVNRKVILPNFIDATWNSFYHENYHRWNEYSDIDRVMSYLAGKKYEGIKTLQSSIRETRVGDSSLHESEFFTFRCYKKGTLHIQFKDEWLWEEFNMRACAGKNWLPEAERREWEKAEMKKVI